MSEAASVEESGQVSTVLAVDPGREKWGLAVLRSTGECLHREVSPNRSAPDRVRDLLARFAASEVLLGDRTGSAQAREIIEGIFRPVILVSEHETTLIARRLYWRYHPPRGWRRWLPRGLLVPAGPLDAYAAEALALRHFHLLDESQD